MLFEISIFRSSRHGLIHYAKGSLLGAVKILFKEDNIRLYIRSNLSTEECKFRIKFISLNYMSV